MAKKSDLLAAIDAKNKKLKGVRLEYCPRNGYHAVDIYVGAKCLRALEVGKVETCIIAVQAFEGA